MKIILAIPGHLRTVPMGKFSEKALLKLGHEVIIFDYKASLSDKVISKLDGSKEEKSGVNKRLRNIIEKQKVNVFITIFGFDISIESLQWLHNKGIPSICWWINDPFQFTRSLTKAPYYDFVFTNSEGCVEQYYSSGVKYAEFLPTACDPDIHKPRPIDSKYTSDICFAGDWSQQRQTMLEGLVNNDIKLRIFGPWKKKLDKNNILNNYLCNGFFTPDEMSKMFSNAKITLNLHAWYGKYNHGLNPRLFEASACGTIQLVDWKQEIPKMYDIENEVICYQTLNELPEKIQKILNLTDIKYKKITENARLRSINEHTYKHRMQTIINHIV